MLAVQGGERAISSLSDQRTQPHNTNPQNESRGRENSIRQNESRGRENSIRQKWNEQLGQQKVIGPASETHQSHTIKYGINKIVPQGYCQGNKIPAVLRSSAVRRRISVSMCDHGAACNLHRQIRHR